MSEFAIIGAGIAGMRTAQLLTAAGHICLVFEKGPMIGGRMATYQQEHWQADYGTQYFTARSPEFKTQVDQWLEQNTVIPWNVSPWTYKDDSFEPSPDEQIRYVGYPCMNTMLETISDKLDIYYDSRIERLERVDKKWRLWDGNGEHFDMFDGVIITPPLAQTLALIPMGLPLELQLRNEKMMPTFSYAIAFSAPTGINKEALFINNGIISWAARDSSKPGRPQTFETWVIHFADNWTTNHLKASEDLLKQQALNLLTQLAGSPLPEIQYSFSHCWLFAKNTKDDATLSYWDEENSIGIAGDWTLGSRMEDAWLSANRLANHLLTKP